MLEVIHVTSLAGVHGVLVLKILGRANVDQVTGILHYKVTFVEGFHSLDAPSLVLNTGNLNTMFGVVCCAKITLDCLQLLLQDLCLGFAFAATDGKVFCHFMAGVGSCLEFARLAATIAAFSWCLLSDSRSSNIRGLSRNAIL